MLIYALTFNNGPAECNTYIKIFFFMIFIIIVVIVQLLYRHYITLLCQNAFQTIHNILSLFIQTV
jgi:hypothetical protein